MFRPSEKDFGTSKEFFKGFDPGNFSFAHNFRRHGGMKYYVLWLLSPGELLSVIKTSENVSLEHLVE